MFCSKQTLFLHSAWVLQSITLYEKTRTLLSLVCWCCLCSLSNSLCNPAIKVSYSRLRRSFKASSSMACLLSVWKTIAVEAVVTLLIKGMTSAPEEVMSLQVYLLGLVRLTDLLQFFLMLFPHLPIGSHLLPEQVVLSMLHFLLLHYRRRPDGSKVLGTSILSIFITSWILSEKQ